ncbi:MAG: DsbC family protein [Steroidobacteraceae bacterium]
MALILGSVLAAPSLWAKDDPTAAIKTALKERYPTITIVAVQPSEVPGIYEVFTGSVIVYTDRTGDHLFTGKLYETKSRRDLSTERLDVYNKIDFDSLPFERAIKIVKGNGSRRLAVFEDPDCPYCQKLESELKDVTDLTVYVFLYPIDDLHPQATRHSKAIWCSPDRAAAWTGWLVDHKPLAEATCIDDPVAAIRKLAASLRVTATPTLFTENGHRTSGAPTAEKLQALLDGSSTPDTAKSAVVTNASGTSLSPAPATRYEADSRAAAPQS